MILALPGVLLAAAGMLWAPLAGPFAHPNHTSYAEVHCNHDTGELQVALAMLALDLEETLSRRVGKRVNLDRTEGIEEIVETYLAERFVVTKADGTTPRPVFSGREDKRKNVWLYFTVPLIEKRDDPGEKGEPAKKAEIPKGSLLTGVRLRNQVLMEYNARQINTVDLREGSWRRTMKFEEKTREQVLRPAAARKSDRPKSGGDRSEAGARRMPGC